MIGLENLVYFVRLLAMVFMQVLFQEKQKTIRGVMHGMTLSVPLFEGSLWFFDGEWMEQQ